MSGMPILYMAAKHGFHKSLKLLINAGAKVNAKNTRNETALHGAVQASSYCRECIEVLLENGADPNIKNRDGRTPAELAGFCYVLTTCADSSCSQLTSKNDH